MSEQVTNGENIANKQDPNKLLSVNDLCELTGECKAVWRTRINSGKIPWLDLAPDGSVRKRPHVRRQDYDQWVEDRLNKIRGE